MLILIAGVTGNLGQWLARSAFRRGVQVRGLGRTPSKLDQNVRDGLESFVTSASWYDTVAIDEAVAGVDAIICAYSGVPQLQLDGQLLLLRAAEREGIKNFHAHSWNYDWSKLKLGEHESYDPFICFHRQVQLSSTIKPLYVFTGVLAEVLFGFPGHVDMSPDNRGWWDPKGKKIELYGSGNEKYQWTTEADAAEFSIALVMSKEAREGQGGFFRFCSGEHSLREIAEVYERVRGKKVNIKVLGDIDALEQKALAARGAAELNRFWEYIAYFYQLFTIKGTWNLTSMTELPGVKRTTLAEFFEQNPEV